MKRSTLTLGVLMAVTLIVTCLPGARADDVTVSVNNPGGTRTVFLETIDGQPLTALDLGDGASQPLRVRVVDSSMDRNGFQVNAEMTNLYRSTGASAWDFSSSVPSSDVSLGYSTTPLNTLDVSALVQPVVDVVGSVPGGLCLLLGLGSCGLSFPDLTANLQTLTVPVDLGQLANLPIVPQAGQAGAFASPSFNGIGATDPAKPGVPSPTSLRMLGGGTGVAGPLLTSLDSTLGTTLSGVPLDSVLPIATVTALLQQTLGAAYDLLSGPQLTSILSTLTYTVDSLGAGSILGQSGTYTSYPTLNVSLPENLDPGTYEGTLVVTAVQL